jgi:peptidyl-prolyl cis-trans isomerase A (cyclophilin A)
MKSSPGFPLLIFLAVLGSCSQRGLPGVEMLTPYGRVVITIDTIRAPVTGKNFLRLVSSGVYGNGWFYRVVNAGNQAENPVKINVVQGGLYDEQAIGKVEAIPHENTSATGTRHRNGTISMARNGPGTASSEFFVCIGRQSGLDFGGLRNPDRQGFAAFGKVTTGMRIIRRIHQMQDSAQYLTDPVKIGSAKIIP